MQSIVISFLLWSVRGGLTAVGAWLAWRALRRLHTPARLLCVLWGAVGLRFLLPWGIPVRLPRPQDARLTEAADTVQEITVFPAVNPVPAADLPAAASAAPWYADLTVWHLLAAVWAAGVLLLLVRAVWGYARLRRRVALAYKTEDGCYTGDCVSTPFTLGLVRPRVYLPQNLCGTVRESVLLHERTHIRRRDLLVKPLFYFACCLHWFNPLAWLAFCRFEREMEAACDEAAVAGHSDAERNAYCEALLQYALHGRGSRSTPGCLAFGQSSVKERITRLLRGRRLGTGALAACVLAVAVCTCACMLRPTTEAAAVEAVEIAAVGTNIAPAPTATPESAEGTVAALNGSLVDFAGALEFPIKDYKYISRKFVSGEHRGTDIAAAAGTPVYAAESGVVLAADYHYSYGNFVQILHDVFPDNGLQLKTVYAHMDSLAVSAGESVTRGQLIGYVGCTGAATGNILHLEVYLGDSLVDPLYFVNGKEHEGYELTEELAGEMRIAALLQTEEEIDAAAEPDTHLTEQQA